MKYFIIIVLSVLMGGCALYANKNKIEKNIHIKLPLIELNDSKVDSLVNVIIKQNQEYFEKDCFILVGLTNGNESNTAEVIITLYEKDRFKLSCPNNDYPIVGYAEIGQQTVLFVGKICIEKVKVTKDKKTFAFTCRQDGINRPPSMYNPIIHKFSIRNNGEIEYTSEK